MARPGKRSIALALVPILVALVLLRSHGQADEPKAKSEATKKADAIATKERDAKKAAETFLLLVDKGQFAESWEASSEWFRKGITRRKWIDALNVTRKPLGRLRSRKLNRIEMKATENPERIDQAWVYSDLRFANGQDFGELVVVVFEKGKEWRTSAYFIGAVETLPKPPVPEKEEVKPAEVTPGSSPASPEAPICLR